jgi:hypothetical protein
MIRSVRYQGAIILSDHILLVQHSEHASGRIYWLLPGGGREEGESEEACVSWGDMVISDPFTYPALKRIQAIVGY